MTDQIVVSLKVAEQLEIIRIEGIHNMLNRSGVQHQANQLGFYETVIWMEENSHWWGELVFNGFMVDAGDLGLISHKDYFAKFPVET